MKKVVCFLQTALLLVLLAAVPVHAQFTSSLPRGDAQAAGFDAEKLRAVDAIIRRAVDQRLIAGGVALVTRKGKVVHVATGGMQDGEAGVPISEGTIYRIASMTKPITSLAAMMLVDEGKLSLDDSVSKFVPEFKQVRVLIKDAKPDQSLEQITTAATTPVTVRQLLNHTSGITYSFWNHPVLGNQYRDAGVDDGLMETPGTAADNARRLAGLPLRFEPGTAWEYGLNTDVLGRVVEVASGQSLAEFFRGRIFEPLGMRDTHFVLPKEKRSRLAALYAPDESKKVRRVGAGLQDLNTAIGRVRYTATYPVADKNEYQSGGAGLVSTMGDYARFLQMLLNRGELDGHRLLKAETVAQMTSNQIGDLSPSIAAHGDKFGLGFGVVTAAKQADEVASVGSFGWGGIFHTYFLVDPQKELAIIFATQIFPFDHLTLHADFKNAVYAALLP